MSISSPYSSISKYILIFIFGILINFIYGKLENKTIFNTMLFSWIINGIIILFLLNSQRVIKGGKRWFILYGISYQPSELFKLSSLICSNYLLDKKRFFSAFLIFMTTILLFAKQPDLGSIFMFISTLLIFFSIQKFNKILILITYGLFIVAIYSSILHFPHARNRFQSFYSQNNSAFGYQNMRALAAIRNGGIFGVGLGNGKIKITIPDAYSDFIFAVIAEELGFIICLLICLSYLIFLIRCLIRGAEKKSLESNILITISSLVAVQSWIHMASNVWLIPTKGTTLPCISHGGTSFIVSHMTLGIVNNFFEKVRKRKVIE